MTRRILSIPVFLLSVAAIAAGAVGLYFLHGWQLSRLSQALLVQASAEEKTEHWLNAAQYLDHYLRLQPQNKPARGKLALVYAKGAKSPPEKERAVNLHYRALASAPGELEDELRLGLAELLMETGRWLEAENEARTILANDADHPKAGRVLALARYRQWIGGALASKRPGELRLLENIEDALAKNPADVALAQIAATLYRDYPDVVAADRAGLNQLSREQIADGLLDRAVKNNPDDAKALLARYGYRAKYQIAGAAHDLERALILAPEDNNVLLVAADAHFGEAKRLQESGAAQDAEKELQAAQKLLEKLIAKDQSFDNPLPYLQLGEVLAQKGALDQALAAWKDSLAKFSKPTVQVLFHASIADNLLKAGRIDESKTVLNSIDGILADLGGTVRREDHLALMQKQGLRRAIYDLHNGYFSDVIAEVQQAIARQPHLQPDPNISYRAWDLLGRGYVGLEDWTEAATAFDRAANFQGDPVAPRLAAAGAWLAAGRADLAVDRAEQVISIKSIPEAWVILATAELHIQAQAPAQERGWARVQAALRGLEQIESAGGVEAPWRIDFIKADYVSLRTPTDDDPTHGPSAAAEMLRMAESKHGERPEFWLDVCMAYERLGQSQDAERAWERLNHLPGTRVEATIAASRRAAIHGNYSEANRILLEAAQNVRPGARALLRQELLRLAQAKQDLAQMKALLLAELQERPSDVGAMCKLAELALRDGDFQALRQWEEKLASVGSLGELWSRYFRVVRLYSSAKDAHDPKLQEALSQQSQLATLRPNWAESYALRGAIEQRLERLEAAVVAYEQAIQLGERRYSVFEQLIACLDQLHRSADVEKYLSRLESYLPISQRLTEIATRQQMNNEKPERAVEIARRAVQQRPDDLRAQLWLGRLLLLTNQNLEAKSVFEQATRDAPQDVRSWNGLFTYYLRIGERERAKQVLESLRQEAKLDTVERDVVLGQGLLRLGETSEAMRLFTELNERAPDRADVHLQLARLYLETNREKAKQHLQRAVEIDPKLAQARWLLAAVFAAGGSEAELAEAEKLLGGTAGAGTVATVEDRRVRALLLAQHGASDGLDRAVRIFEQIVSEGGDIANDRLLLAQFYERQATSTPDPAQAAAKLKASRDQLVMLASRSRAQTSDVAALVDFLLRQNQNADADVWLDRLEQRISSQSKEDPRAIAQLIDLRIRHGTADMCEVWIAKLEAIDRDPVRPLVARAKYLAAKGKLDEIEPMVEEKGNSMLAAASQPEERSRIARAIGDLYLSINHLAGAERWYRVVIREDPQQFQFLAAILMRQGRAREAIALCGAAAEHDSTSRPAVVLTSILLEAGGKAEHIKLAETMLAAALEKFPEDADLLYGVGMLRVFQDLYPDAIPLLRKVVSIKPRHVAALNNLAVLLAETPDRRQEALELVEQAINLRGQEPTLLDTKGTILVFGGRSKDAVSLLEAAARGTNSDPRHKFHLAMAYQDIGAPEKAREQFGAALQQDLDRQILTPTDRKSLEGLRAALKTLSL